MAFLDDSDRQESILLDVLNEDCHYENVVELAIDGPFLKIEGLNEREMTIMMSISLE